MFKSKPYFQYTNRFVCNLLQKKVLQKETRVGVFVKYNGIFIENVQWFLHVTIDTYLTLITFYEEVYCTVSYSKATPSTYPTITFSSGSSHMPCHDFVVDNSDIPFDINDVPWFDHSKYCISLVYIVDIWNLWYGHKLSN